MNTSLESAYVLHARHYRETSGLIEFFTKDSGRICLLAKGYKSNTKSRKSYLQPFRKLSIGWSGRSELKTLSVAEEVNTPIKFDNQTLISGLYINEIMIRLLQPLDPHPELFDIYEETVQLLEMTENVELVLRLFERDILEVMGYGLQLLTDSDGSDIGIDEEYCYIADIGPVKSNKSFDGGILLKGKTLLSLHASIMNDADVLRESKLLMRYVLSRYLGNKPLKTRELFRYY